MATSFFTPEDAHLARDLERTLINAQQEAPRFLKEIRLARFSYQEGDHVVSLIDFHTATATASRPVSIGGSGGQGPAEMPGAG
jgi:hypothetical protein